MNLAMSPEPTADAVPGPLRTCIVTGETAAPERMIRFVVGPEGDVVPELARRLPGRGMWLRAEQALLEQAIARKAFARAARAPVKAAADLPQLLDRFYQSRSTVAPATADGGRGLGLAIVKRIAELHGGDVAVESVVGRGTRVVLTVPAAGRRDVPRAEPVLG